MQKPKTLKPINQSSKGISTFIPSQTSMTKPVQKMQKRNMILNKDFAQVK
jgi:hypothetical protein